MEAIGSVGGGGTGETEGIEKDMGGDCAVAGGGDVDVDCVFGTGGGGVTVEFKLS